MLIASVEIIVASRKEPRNPRKSLREYLKNNTKTDYKLSSQLVPDFDYIIGRM